MTTATDYPSVLFGLLAAAIICGAGGILFSRRRLTCISYWMLCSTALSGFCLLFDLHFLAISQLTVSLYLAGIILVISRPQRRAPAHNISALLHPGHVLWYVAGGALFVSLVWLLATNSQATTQAMLGDPALNSLPMWAARGDHISALGQELANRHSLLLTLLGFLILASIVSVAYLRRSRQGPEGRGQ
jgi:NADH:ubiquinone oxidoreductase subunit 6 (subunit J)